MEPQSGGTVSHEDELTALRQKLDSSVSPEVWSNTLRRAEDLQQRLEASEEENARVLGLLLDLRKAHSVQQGRMQAFLEGEVEAPLPHSPPPCHADADAATPMPCSPDAALESALRELAYRTEHQVEEVAFLEEARATERQEHSLDCHLQEGLFRKELLQAEEQVYNEARRAEAAELVARRLKAAAAQEAEAASAVQARLAAACSRKVERKRDRIADLEMQLLRLEGELLKAQQEGGAAPQPDSAAPTPPPADAAETADRRSSQLEERMVELALEVEAAAAMREAHDDLQDRVGELSAEANQYRTQLEDSQRALAELPLQADRLEEMEARAAGLAEENARAAERVAQLQEECASLQRDRDELRQQADGTQGQLDDSMRQVEGMAARIAEAERDHLSETARLRGDLQGVQADAERLRGESGAALQAAEERRAEAEQVRVELERAATSLAEMEGKQEEERRGMEQRLAASQEAAAAVEAALRAEVAAAAVEKAGAVEALEADIAAMGSTMAQLQAELDRVRAEPPPPSPEELEALRAELGSSREEGEGLRAKLAEAREALARAPPAAAAPAANGPALVNVRGAPLTPTTGPLGAPARPPSPSDSSTSLRVQLDEMKRQLSRSQEDCLTLRRRLHRDGDDTVQSKREDPQTVMLQHRVIALEELVKHRNEAYEQSQRELSRVRGSQAEPAEVEQKLRQELASCRRDMAKLSNTHRELLSELDLSQNAKRAAEKKMSEALDKLAVRQSRPQSPQRISHVDPLASLQDSLKSRGRRGDEKKVATLANHLSQIAVRGHMTEAEVDEAVLLMLERRDVPTRQRPQTASQQPAPMRPPRASSPGLSHHVPRASSPGISHTSRPASPGVSMHAPRMPSPSILHQPRSPLYRTYPHPTMPHASAGPITSSGMHRHPSSLASASSISNGSPALSAAAAPNAAPGRRMSPGRPGIGRSPERRMWR